MTQENGKTEQSVPRQAMEVMTKVATWATIAVLAFFTSTVLSLDKNYGIMSAEQTKGFSAITSHLDRIEKKQDENSSTIQEHDTKLAAIMANRFTDEDSADLLRSFGGSIAKMDEKVQELWKAIGDMKASVPAAILLEVRRLEESMKEMQREVDRLREKVASQDK